MAGPAVRVQGLKEARRALRTLSDDGTWKPELRAVNKSAAEIVVVEARSRAARGGTNLAGGPARLGSKGIGSIRALASQTKATVAGGGASVPWYGGSDFGSGGAHRQFPAKLKKGRFIYPAIDDKMTEILRAYTRGLDRLTSKYFNE